MRTSTADDDQRRPGTCSAVHEGGHAGGLGQLVVERVDRRRRAHGSDGVDRGRPVAKERAPPPATISGLER